MIKIHEFCYQIYIIKKEILCSLLPDIYIIIVSVTKQRETFRVIY